jgi:hypothetical protein
VFDIIAGIFHTWASIFTGDWQGAWDGISQIVDGTLKVLEGLLKLAYLPFTTAWNLITDAVGAAWNAAMEYIKKKWNDFRTWIGGKWTEFKGWVDKWTLSPSEIWKAIQTKWADMRAWVGDKWEAFKSWVKGWSPSIPDIWDKIQDKWHDMRAWVGDKWEAFKTWVKGWSPGIPDIWDSITEKWGDMKTWVETHWASFKTWVSGFVTNPSGVFDGFKTEFRSVINTIIGWWNGLSFTLNIPNKIPGLPDSVTISTPNVGYLAQGGYITDPGLFVVGEGGEPEIVSPESKMKEIVSQYSGSRIDYVAMADAIATALSRIMGEQITRDDIEELIARAGMNIQFDRTNDSDDFRNLMFELRRMGYGGAAA